MIGYNYMLKNKKVGHNWIFQMIIGYCNWMFLIPVVLSLVFLLLLLMLFFFGELETTEG